MIDSGEPQGGLEYISRPERNIQRIRAFPETLGYSIHQQTDDTSSLWLVGPPVIEGLDTDTLQAIMQEQQQLRLTSGLPHTECYTIAAKAVMDNTPITFGVLDTQDASKEFTGYPNHALNYITLPSGVAFSVDYMAGTYIDPQKSHFSLLCVYGKDVPELLEHLQQLYTGTWNTVEPHRVKDIYLAKYGTPEQQQRAKENMRQKNI